MDAMHGDFRSPSAAWHSAPLWVWNDLMTPEAIDAQLKELHGHGFGGAFVHPRPGMVTDYLSDEWFAVWGHALKTAKALGMKLYIYDENSYPSGFAGGHVSSQLPDCLATGATYRVTDDPYAVRGAEIVKAFVCRREAGELEILEDITMVKQDAWKDKGRLFFVVAGVKAPTSGWLGGFGYVDVLRPEVTKLFLETSYESYFERFGDDFGTNIPAIFTDEPNIGNGGGYTGDAPALPFSFWLAEQFRERNGYSLLAHLPCIFMETKGPGFTRAATKVRHDYYRTLHDLWVQNTIAPIGKWCGDHGIAWTGHYLEHQWPFAFANNASPSIQSFYEYHQWPAIDMLLSNYLRDTETHALTLTIQEIRSAANQFGKERTLCELYGAGGWDSTFEDYKRMGDWVLVNGINFINQHLTYSTIAGARKRDHPQSFDWRQPWWDEYTVMNDYLARASYMLSQGVMEQRILLLNPSTTGYLVPYEEEKGGIFGDASTDAIQNPDMGHFLRTVQALADGQWDYDLGDEYTMARHAHVRDGKVILGKQTYDMVIVSGDMKNMLGSTVELLGELSAQEGVVLACGMPGPYVDGNPAAKVYERMAKAWRPVADDAALNEALDALLPKRLRSGAGWPAGVTHMRRRLPDGRTVYFFVNHHMGAFETALSLPGTSVAQWDLFTGEAVPVAHTAASGWVTMQLSLERNQSAMLVVDGAAQEAPGKKAATQARELPLTLVSVRPDRQNVLPIGYCDLSLDGADYKDISVLRAADIVFMERGFDRNPWDNKVQYRNNLMNRNAFGPDSGFEVAYHFEVAQSYLPGELRVVAEHPAFCSVLINGTPVPWLPGEHDLDAHFGVADIAAHVRPGMNAVTVRVPVFDVRMEMESIYLRGDFAVTEKDNRWMITGAKPLGHGSWQERGYPFYDGAMVYDYRLKREKAGGEVLINATKYGATTVSVRVNGQAAGLLNADGIRPLDISAFAVAGENRITLRVCGSMKNLMGPHFMAEPVRGSAWPGMWKDAPLCQPGADAYDLLVMGLLEPPTALEKT